MCARFSHVFRTISRSMRHRPRHRACAVNIASSAGTVLLVRTAMLAALSLASVVNSYATDDRVRFEPQSGHDPYSKLTQAASSPNGDLVATSASDGNIILWEATTARQIWKARPSAAFTSAYGVVFTPDGKSLFASFWNGASPTLVQIDTTSGMILASSQVDIYGQIRISHNGRYLALLPRTSLINT